MGKKGIVYGVGVGPGDPELMTLKAVRLIRENEVIAFPGQTASESTAFRIADMAVEGMENKQLLPLDMPMSADWQLVRKKHREAAEVIEDRLDQGGNVVFLALGDVSIYCSFSYLQRILVSDGYEVETVSGVTSFSAAAACLGIPLSLGEEPLHIIPASGCDEDILRLSGTIVLMKSGRQLRSVKQLLCQAGREAQAVINCGMPGETVCRCLDEIPDEAGYFTLIISR